MGSGGRVMDGSEGMGEMDGRVDRMGSEGRSEGRMDGE